MKILFVASEMTPFVKTGGLGDVVGGLPKYLRGHEVDVRVVIPHYSMIYGLDYRMSYMMPRRQGDGVVDVHTKVLDDVPVYFLKSWPYFVEDGKIYTDWEWDTPRYIYFSQMATAFIWQLASGALDGGKSWWPDVVHVHDWHTGLVPFLLHQARFNPGWQDVATVLTIHNMAFQGPYAGGWLWQEGLPDRDHAALPWRDLRDNLLAIGIAYAEKVNTVSPQHAVELHYPRFGEGLESVIQARGADFSGILNGLDTRFYDPATDKHLETPYDADTFREKRVENKVALQKRQHLEVNPNIPLIAYVGRLTNQKGMDFAIPAIRYVLASTEAQFIGLGTGDSALESAFGQIGMDFNWKARTYLMFSDPLSRQIYAGADLVLVPSRYEPCGLTQMLAMRYGALPLVRETGGLMDSVDNYDGGAADQGTGFRFLFEDSGSLERTVDWALRTYYDNRPAWVRMQERAMRRDWSWETASRAYIRLYEQAIAKKRAWRSGG
ncbi:MAG: glycogen synthase [Anaerolineae bacterium]|nr:MAG: glycogen synthase [Anaerolineae bacterium]